MPSEMAFRTHFGSWGNALQEAGFEVPKPFPSEKCIKNMIKAHKGKRSFHWKGGRMKNKFGYIQVWRPEHENASKSGYVLEHRLIMSDFLGRKLLRNELVHHIDGNKINNILSNLKLISIGKHTTLHFKGVLKNKKFVCRFCKTKTNSKYLLCNKHYKRMWSLKKAKKINSLYTNPELLTGDKK